MEIDRSFNLSFPPRYICELGLGVYSLAHIAPSKLSAAALALAMRLVEPSASFSSLWSPALVHYTKYTAEELGAVITPLAEVLFLAPSAKLGKREKLRKAGKLFCVGDYPGLASGELVGKLTAGTVSHVDLQVGGGSSL